jgi:glutamate-1-semialdehyde 2,1-aminomutase
MGRTELIAAAERVYFIGTHFFSGVPFAAALATIEEIKASSAIEKIDRMGRLLMKGLVDAALGHDSGSG